MPSKLPDSGKREAFVTGAEREPVPVEKGRYDLIPDVALHRLAVHYARGAAKYAPRNWEKGLALGRYLDAARRHLGQFAMGDTSEDHLAAAAWNVFAMIWTTEKIKAGELPPWLNDLPEHNKGAAQLATAAVERGRGRPASVAAQQIGASVTERHLTSDDECCDD